MGSMWYRLGGHSPRSPLLPHQGSIICPQDNSFFRQRGAKDFCSANSLLIDTLEPLEPIPSRPERKQPLKTWAWGWNHQSYLRRKRADGQAWEIRWLRKESKETGHQLRGLPLLTSRKWRLQNHRESRRKQTPDHVSQTWSRRGRLARVGSAHGSRQTVETTFQPWQLCGKF